MEVEYFVWCASDIHEWKYLLMFRLLGDDVCSTYTHGSIMYSFCIHIYVYGAMYATFGQLQCEWKDNEWRGRYIEKVIEKLAKRKVGFPKMETKHRNWLGLYGGYYVT